MKLSLLDSTDVQGISSHIAVALHARMYVHSIILVGFGMNVCSCWSL